MRRYILFAGDDYYPNGGMNDYRGSFNSVADAKESIECRSKEGLPFDWYQIVDKDSWDVVERNKF